MPREVEKTEYVCSHPQFKSCQKTSDNKAVIQYHERRHEIDHLIDQISDVHDHLHFVQEEVVTWLENWLEHGKMAGLTECQECGREVHELFDQCPECYGLVHELETHAVLVCGECGSDRLRVMRKGEQRRKQGYRCTDCGEFVAHGNGTLSFWNNAPEINTLGEWDEDAEDLHKVYDDES